MQVVYSIAAYLGRGIGYTAENAINQIKQNGIEVKPFTLMQYPELERSPFKDMEFDRKVAEDLPKCDLLHVWNNMGLHTIRVAKKRDMKVIVERASTHPDWQDRVLNDEVGGCVIDPMYKDRMLQEYELADGILTPSQFAYNTFPERLKPKVRVIPFGVDCQKFKPAPKRHNNFRVLFAGDNVLRKGIRYLIDAWKLMPPEHSELWLKIPGKPTTSGSIRTIAEVPDMAELYNMVDIFCLPSLEEGQALVVWEAMACGLPCVVTEECGSLIKNNVNGIVVPSKNSKAIYHALMDLATSPLKRERLGQAARQLAEQYSWERYGKNLVEAYKKIMAG